MPIRGKDHGTDVRRIGTAELASYRMHQRFSMLLFSGSTASHQPLKPEADEDASGSGGRPNAHAQDSIDFRLARSSFGSEGD